MQSRDEEGNLRVIEVRRGKNASRADAEAFQADRKSRVGDRRRQRYRLLSARELFDAIQGGQKAVLSNGWEIVRSKVNHERRVENSPRRAVLGISMSATPTA